MSDEEMKAMLNLEHIVEYWEPDDEDDEFEKIEYNSIKVAVNLIYKLRKENAELHKEINQRVKLKIENEKIGDELYRKIDKLQADRNKLINYIAIRENKTHEEVCKEFELGE